MFPPKSSRGGRPARRGGQFVSRRGGRAANKWVRPTQEVIQEPSVASSNVHTKPATTGVILKGPRHYPAKKSHHSWKRPREKPETTKGDATETVASGAVSERVQKDDVYVEQGTAKPSDRTLIRCGRNKLVLNKPKESAVNISPAASAQRLVQNERGRTVERESSTLPVKKRALNTLVLTRMEDNSSSHHGNESVPEMGGHNKRDRLESSRGRAKCGAKRIKLNPDETEMDDAEMPPAGEKYTEFAYRQTVSRRGRGRGRGGAAKSNMGLVRVEPDLRRTPICTTYIRGVPCTNPKCKKRHDVPKEAATPICSFFQRHGQCKKRDTCPFRHIKISAHATVCPSFSVLGFCADKDCVMKHIHVAKNKPGT